MRLEPEARRVCELFTATYKEMGRRLRLSVTPYFRLNTVKTSVEFFPLFTLGLGRPCRPDRLSISRFDLRNPTARENHCLCRVVGRLIGYGKVGGLVLKRIVVGSVIVRMGVFWRYRTFLIVVAQFALATAPCVPMHMECAAEAWFIMGAFMIFLAPQVHRIWFDSVTTSIFFDCYRYDRKKTWPKILTRMQEIEKKRMATVRCYQ